MIASNKLTDSRMSCAKNCLRRHCLMYELGIRKIREAGPRRVGKNYHCGCELLDKFHLEEALAEIADIYSEYPAWCRSEEDQFGWQVEYEIVSRLVSGLAWVTKDSQTKVIETEFCFEVPIINPETGRPTPNFVLAGKIDNIIELPDTRLAVRERKTTGDSIDVDSDYWKQLRLDQQITTYYLGAQDRGFDIQTIFYEAAHKPQIRPKQIPKGSSKKSDEENRGTLQEIVKFGTYFNEPIEPPKDGRETPAMFGARLGYDICSRPDFYFATREIPRLDADIEEFRYELWQIQKLLRDCQKYNRWPRNTSLCLHPYKCDMWELCVNGWQRGDPLPANYEYVENVHPELGD